LIIIRKKSWIISWIKSIYNINLEDKYGVDKFYRKFRKFIFWFTWGHESLEHSYFFWIRNFCFSEIFQRKRRKKKTFAKKMGDIFTGVTMVFDCYVFGLLDNFSNRSIL
jgi:hypothetical protein